MSAFDRVARLLIIATIVVLYFLNIINGTLAIILLAVAGILLLTTFINFCPIYKVLGVSSLKKK